MISPDRLERYRDFVDPEHTGAPYDPRQGIERLMGVLSPDPKGIVLAAMGEDWYGGFSQLQSGVFSFLEKLGLKSSIWPLTVKANWSYIELKDKHTGQIIEGSLVELGAVVKKIEPTPFKLSYQRSLAGVELAVPLVQQAFRFVVEAREYAERQKLQGKEPPKFDSMIRIIGTVNSATDQRRPLAVFNTVDFLVHHLGSYSERDLEKATQISQARLTHILPFLGNCGVIDYISPMKEKGGQAGRGWSVYALVDPQAVINLNPPDIYQDIRNKKKNFNLKTALVKIIDYVKEHPNEEFEHSKVAERLKVRPEHAMWILSLLTTLSILRRPDPGFKGAKMQTIVSANDFTHLFYDLVCDPLQEVANTLSPLPIRSWNRQEIATYLQNYEEERNNVGQWGGEDARGLLLKILSVTEGEMKLSHLADSYNEQAEREIKAGSVRANLQILINMGLIEQPKCEYYRLVKK